MGYFFCIVIGFVIGTIIIINFEVKNKDNAKELSEKYLSSFQMLNQWIRLKNNGREIYDYLIDRDINKVAVYGMSYVGNTLVDDLKQSNVKVIYGIDRNKNAVYSDVEIRSLSEVDESIDAIIVTIPYYYEKIESDLSKITTVPILSLEKIIYDMDIVI